MSWSFCLKAQMSQGRKTVRLRLKTWASNGRSSRPISLCFRKKKLYTCALGLQGAEVGGKGEEDEKGCEGEGWPRKNHPNHAFLNLKEGFSGKCLWREKCGKQHFYDFMDIFYNIQQFMYGFENLLNYARVSKKFFHLIQKLFGFLHIGLYNQEVSKCHDFLASK